jgi:hypothetical protein
VRGGALPIQDETEEVVCQQANGQIPVLRLLRVMNRFRRITVCGKPPGSRAVQLSGSGRLATPQLALQQVGE